MDWLRSLLSKKKKDQKAADEQARTAEIYKKKVGETYPEEGTAQNLIGLLQNIRAQWEEGKPPTVTRNSSVDKLIKKRYVTYLLAKGGAYKTSGAYKDGAPIPTESGIKLLKFLGAASAFAAQVGLKGADRKALLGVSDETLRMNTEPVKQFLEEIGGIEQLNYACELKKYCAAADLSQLAGILHELPSKNILEELEKIKTAWDQGLFCRASEVGINIAQYAVVDNESGYIFPNEKGLCSLDIHHAILKLAHELGMKTADENSFRELWNYPEKRCAKQIRQTLGGIEEIKKNSKATHEKAMKGWRDKMAGLAALYANTPAEGGLGGLFPEDRK